VTDWGVLLSTFGLVFVAELGDKTQLAVVTQTCRFRRPWPVFLGASLALVAVTALGAVGGRMLATLIPPTVMRNLAAALFVGMGALIGWRARGVVGGSGQSCEITCDPEEAISKRVGWDWHAFGSTLSLLFIAELGDKTQLAVLGLAGKDASPWGVFIGGALALVAVTALGVLGGEQLSRLIPERTMLRVSAAAFVVMGLLMAVRVL
jgi:putative Ca2+/H+ antiporter (TMEM165/GDT1 family)